MFSVTVPGGGGRPGHSAASPDLIALYIAIEVELEAYRKWRAMTHMHNRTNQADSAAAAKTATI